MAGAARNVAVIGRGLIGHSIELALRRLASPPDLVALDKSDSLDAAAGADLIFLAAPISENIRILGQLAGHVSGEAIVTDTGSTKRTTLAAAEVLPPRLRFIGGHPVAGAATHGSAGAAADLFDGRLWLLTPTSETSTRDLATLSSSIESLGAVVRLVNAAQHDHLLAYVSHLPQFAVSALTHAVGQAVGAVGLSLAGGGLRDSTRLAGSAPGIWKEIAASNEDHVNAALDELIRVLTDLRHRRDDVLDEVFESAARWKDVLDKSNRP